MRLCNLKSRLYNVPVQRAGKRQRRGPALARPSGQRSRLRPLASVQVNQEQAGHSEGRRSVSAIKVGEDFVDVREVGFYLREQKLPNFIKNLHKNLVITK